MKPARRLLTKALAPVWQRLPQSIRQIGVSLRETLYTVSAVGVIVDDDDRVLLLEHALRLPSLGLPGGFVARGEQPEDTVRREVREEVGLEVRDVALVLVRGLAATPQIEIVFRARAAGTPAADGIEIRAARWVPIAALPAGLHPDAARTILRALGRARG
jgi:ADP-ribose pyrophosphatase YjhB (NUDIX family)